jgi:RimJ/RimL family protein N-acetyltransferase
MLVSLSNEEQHRAMSRSVRDKERELRLKGRVVELRNFTSEDITESYLEWLRNPWLMRFSNQRFRTHDLNSCRAFLHSFAGTENLFLAIWHESTLIGTMTAYRSPSHGTADIGLLIGVGFQGKGFGKDAWTTLMDHLLAKGVRKVTGGTLRCNSAMMSIMQRCGMRADGVRVGQELVDGVAHDMLYFAKFAF